MYSYLYPSGMYVLFRIYYQIIYVIEVAHVITWKINILRNKYNFEDILINTSI
jgi:hypothetical protein